MKISYSLVIVFIGLITLCVGLQDISCIDPQKTAFMSFNALSKRDTIQNVFVEANTGFNKYDFIYNFSTTTLYNISALLPQFYYNEHFQRQTYVNVMTANVSLGTVIMGHTANYSIVENGTIIKKGYFWGNVHADEGYFTKSLGSVDGNIDWNPVDVPNFTVSRQLPIQFSDPKLTHEEALNFELMLNDNVGDRKMKEKIVISYSIHFRELLKKHLNDQHLFQNNNFTYKYKNISIDFITPSKSTKLTNDGINGTKGLECQFFLQISNYTQKCNKLPTTFDKSFGGVQELISIQTINSTFFYGLSKNMYNTVVNKNWQVPSFQFYMGDLANVIPYAESNFPKEPITGTCNYDDNVGIPQLGAYDDTSIAVEIPYHCVFQTTTQKIFQIKTGVNFVMKIIAEPEQLVLKVSKISSFNNIYIPINPNYVVENKLLADQYVRRVLQGIVGRQVFGSGWNTTYRRYPSIKVFQDYVLVFDASQM